MVGNAILAWGARGPEFKSRRSDQLNQWQPHSPERPPPPSSARRFKPIRLNATRFDQSWDRMRGAAVRLTAVLLQEDDGGGAFHRSWAGASPTKLPHRSSSSRVDPADPRWRCCRQCGRLLAW